MSLKKSIAFLASCTRNTREWKSAERIWPAHLVLIAAIAAISLTTAAHATGPVLNWSFKGIEVEVVDAQDEIRVLGACVAIPNCNDEPYLIQIAFRVRIDEPNSAQTWVVSSRNANPENVPEGETRTLAGAAQAEVTFNGIQSLDTLSQIAPGNVLEIVGAYTWALEEDTVPVDTAANDVASVFADALNSTFAVSALPNGDADQLVSLITAQLQNAYTLLLSNIPLLGLGDDVMGGAFYIGIGASSALATDLDAAIGTAVIPALPIPVLDLPPDVLSIGLYTMGGTTNFTQAFDQAGDGIHEYMFQADGTIASCLAGTFLASPTDTTCTDASPGFFVPIDGATSQSPCPFGKYQDLSGATECKWAPAGTFVDALAAIGPTDCSPGKFQALEGQASCEDAPIGTYVDAPAATSPTTCPPGTSTLAPGATSASACVPAQPVPEPKSVVYLLYGLGGLVLVSLIRRRLERNR